MPEVGRPVTQEEFDAASGTQHQTVTVTTVLGSAIRWQDVPRGQTGGVLVGDIPETILPLLIERMRLLITSPNTYSRETDEALRHLEAAQDLLAARRRDREARAVSGTYTP